ncbi:MAG TPA: YihA family ribosome biogenesis GTP-binding protein, partial [Bacteroidetes bacterium]|nr:YihA family ribosome biogenesis GTP-binding protein [Bacteroidota bacterium]
MDFTSVVYSDSFSKVEDCPPAGKPEFAFIGRSNVGKSSLINALCERKALAFTSSQPGKTQSINFYTINDAWLLVDLPGYGYAKVSKTMRSSWKVMVEGYLENRESLFCVFQLIDHAIPPQQADIDFSNWLGEREIPFVLVFTKADKRSKDKKTNTVKAYLEKLAGYWEV